MTEKGTRKCIKIDLNRNRRFMEYQLDSFNSTEGPITGSWDGDERHCFTSSNFSNSWTITRFSRA